MRRFSIRSLMVGMLLLGLGLTAIRQATPFWASAVFTGTIFSVVVGTIGAVQCEGRRRAGWFGYVIGGGVYLALAFGPVLSDAYQARLISSNILGMIRLEARLQSRRDGMTAQLGVLELRRARLIEDQQALASRVARSATPSLEESLALISNQIKDIDASLADQSASTPVAAFWARWLPSSSRERELAVIVHCLTASLLAIGCALISIRLRGAEQTRPTPAGPAEAFVPEGRMSGPA